MVTLIRERKDFTKLTPNDVLWRILAHELMDDEAKEVKNIMKHGSHSKTKDIALKAKGKIKQDPVSSASEASDEEEEATSMMVKKFRKFLSYSKGKKTSYKPKKRACFGQTFHCRLSQEEGQG